MKTDGEIAYCILGVENQTDIHYAMPVRNMLYDAMQLSKQVIETANVLNIITNSKLKIDSNEEEIDMCIAIQQMREDAKSEGIIEGKTAGKIDAERDAAIKMLKDGIITIEQISKYFSSLSPEDIEKLKAEVLQLA